MVEIKDEVIESHIQKIIEIVKGIKKNRLTILVGQNGCGKSLIRKQLGVRFSNEFNDSNKTHTKAVSMQLRTEQRAEYGALSTVMHDSSYVPTSLTSFNLVQSMMKCTENKISDYLILDEIEIGMSEESILGMSKYMLENIDTWVNNSLGLLLITHSRVLVQELMSNYDCDFVYLGYNEIEYDYDKWLTRNLTPTDFEYLSEWSDKLFKTVLNKSREKV